jgi:hypothetical protein
LRVRAKVEKYDTTWILLSFSNNLKGAALVDVTSIFMSISKVLDIMRRRSSSFESDITSGDMFFICTSVCSAANQLVHQPRDLTNIPMV